MFLSLLNFLYPKSRLSVYVENTFLPSKILKLFSCFSSLVYCGTVFPFVYTTCFWHTSWPHILSVFIERSRTVDLQLPSTHHTLCKPGFIGSTWLKIVTDQYIWQKTETYDSKIKATVLVLLWIKSQTNWHNPLVLLRKERQIRDFTLQPRKWDMRSSGVFCGMDG